MPKPNLKAEELKPCASCGGKALLVKQTIDYIKVVYFICCENCESCTQDNEHPSFAASQWNGWLDDKTN